MFRHRACDNISSDMGEQRPEQRRILEGIRVVEVATHISQPWPAKQLGQGHGRAVVVPAPLGEPYADLIVLYRIDRERLDLLDRPHQGALK